MHTISLEELIMAVRRQSQVCAVSEQGGKRKKLLRR